MKEKSKNRFTEWAKTAKSSDKFASGTQVHTKAEWEEILGIEKPAKHKKEVNSYADMEQTHHIGSVEEHGDGDSESTE